MLPHRSEGGLRQPIIAGVTSHERLDPAITLAHIGNTPHLARLGGLPGARVNIASPDPLVLPNGRLSKTRVFGRTPSVTGRHLVTLPSRGGIGNERYHLDTRGFFVVEFSVGIDGRARLPYRHIVRTEGEPFGTQYHVKDEGHIEGMALDTVTIGQTLQVAGREGAETPTILQINQVLTVFTERPATAEESLSLRHIGENPAGLMTVALRDFADHVGRIEQAALFRWTRHDLGLIRAED